MASWCKNVILRGLLVAGLYRGHRRCGANYGAKRNNPSLMRCLWGRPRARPG